MLTTIENAKSLNPKEYYNKIMDKLNNKEHISKSEGKDLISDICLNRCPLFEPYLIQIMDSICSQDGNFSNKNRNIRELYYEIIILVLDNININAISIILKPIYNILNHYRWESQYYGLKSILYLTESKTDSIRQNLQEIIL